MELIECSSKFVYDVDWILKIHTNLEKLISTKDDKELFINYYSNKDIFNDLSDTAIVNLLSRSLCESKI
jgi:hypothetical protein